MCVGAVALILGLVVLAAAPGSLATVVGFGLLGVAGIDLVSLAFLLVGESEDRDLTASIVRGSWVEPAHRSPLYHPPARTVTPARSVARRRPS
jgi:hypothetical protein